MNKCEDAISKKYKYFKVNWITFLQNALELNQRCYGDKDLTCANLMTLLANSYSKIEEYDQAVEYISKVFSYMFTF